MKKLSKLITKLLVVPVIVGTLAGCGSKLKIEKYVSTGTAFGVRGRLGYSVTVGQRDAYHMDKEVHYRKHYKSPGWERDEGYWKKDYGISGGPSWAIVWHSSKLSEVSEEEVPIYVKGLLRLEMDYDKGEVSANADFRKEDWTVTNKEELKELNKQANEWIKKAREYYK